MSDIEELASKPRSERHSVMEDTKVEPKNRVGRPRVRYIRKVIFYFLPNGHLVYKGRGRTNNKAMEAGAKLTALYAPMNQKMPFES